MARWLAAVILTGLLLGAYTPVNAANPPPWPEGAPNQPAGSSLSSQFSTTLAQQPKVPPSILGSATLDLELLAQANSIGEADNVRWSLVQGTPAADKYYDSETGVAWKALRSASQNGSLLVKAGKSWSFTDTFGYKAGYKYASGVYAGGHCALATVFKTSARRAGLLSYYWLHWWPIPGFSYYDSVAIWWGKNDLVIYNSTAKDIVFLWELTPQALSISILPAIEAPSS